MRTHLLFLAAIAISLLFNSCKKNSGEKFSLKGRIFQGCTSAPLANQQISFFQRISADWVGQTSGGDLGSATTDANGEFIFSYTAQNDNDIKNQKAAGSGFSDIVIGVPGKQNVENLIIHHGPRTTVQVRLNVLKPYTANDTLFISDYRSSTFLKVTGPFTSGVLYNAPNQGFENYYHQASYPQTVRYKIGNNSSWNDKNFQVAFCDTSRVTVI